MKVLLIALLFLSTSAVAQDYRSDRGGFDGVAELKRIQARNNVEEKANSFYARQARKQEIRDAIREQDIFFGDGVDGTGSFGSRRNRD